MHFDDLVYQYFGSRCLDDIEEGPKASGIARMQVDFGLSRESGQRFALWSVLYLLEAAPVLDVAFPDAAEREAARNLMDLMARAEQGPDA